MLLKFCRWNYVPKFLKFQLGPDFFLSIPPPPGLLPVLGPLERYMTPTLDTALLCSSRAGSDLGRTSDWLRSFVNWVVYTNRPYANLRRCNPWIAKGYHTQTTQTTLITCASMRAILVGVDLRQTMVVCNLSHYIVSGLTIPITYSLQDIYT